MVWRDSFPPANELTLDAEAERERRLAAQARAGADWALTALVARYQPAVTRYLTRLCGDQGRARVLAERVFQRMERRLHGPHGSENLRLWLLRASTESGLDAIRRPRRAPAPRLDATRIAGLLPARATEAGAQAEQVIRGGIKGIKRIAGAVSRQARPLVWQSPAETLRDSSQPGHSEGQKQQNQRGQQKIEPGPVDEAFGGLDPREALRLRLVRLTLADLPYGDAQCLALHLVAGLNQAEVARALGITSSAARKRIVQGLSQFSTRYQAAVRAMGLPDELGYGDALPRQRVEDLPIFAPAEPPPAPPIVVSQTPEENPAEPQYESPYLAPSAPTTIPLQIESLGPLNDAGVPTSGVSFYATSSPEIPVYEPANASPADVIQDEGPEEFYTLENQEAESSGPEEFYTLESPTLENQEAFAGSYDGAFSEPYAEPDGTRRTPPFADDSYEPYEPYGAEIGAVEDTQSPFDEPDESLPPLAAAPEFDELDVTGGPGSVMRVARDAIVGPVVDALPVDSEPYAPPPGYGAASARSMPLTYELMSGVADSVGITMNLMDADSGMAPMSFEAVAAPDVGPEPAGVAPGGSDDPWAASTVLDLEAHSAHDAPIAPVAQDGDATHESPGDDDTRAGQNIPPELNLELGRDDYVWERAEQAAPPERGTPVPPVEERPIVDGQRPLLDNAPGVTIEPDAARAPRPVSRSLEDLWDEAPDLADSR